MNRKFKGHKTIHGPEQLQYDPFNPGRRIASPAEYLGWHAATVTTKGVEPWDSHKKATARINHGRWIADCVWCTGAALTRPDWGVAYCATCGARYHKKYVKFPPNPEQLEAPLLLRVKRELQNWKVGETVKDLEEENKRPDVKTVADVERENIEEVEEP